MDILDNLNGTEEVDLNELIPTNSSLVTYPQASIRNRAATAALLGSSPDNAITDYQVMVNESQQGSNSMLSQKQQEIAQVSNKNDMKGVMSVLSDPTIDIEVKRNVINSLRNNSFLNDESNTLLTNSLTASSSGETEEQEAARITIADAIREIDESRNAVQGLVNSHGASLDSGTGSQSFNLLGEMIETYVMPFGNTIAAGKLASAIAEKQGKPLSPWDKVKAYLLPGSAIKSNSDLLMKIPPEKRVEFAQAILAAIQENNGIVFSNKNQFNQFDKASSIFQDGGYSNFEAFLDNVSPLLDAIGIGQLIRGSKRAYNASKVTKATETLPQVNLPVVEGSKPISETVKPVQKEQIATLLGGTGKKPEKQPEKVAALLQRIEVNGTVFRENPSAPAKIIQQANPEQARNLHEAVVKSTDDSVAEGLYGASRTDAIASDIVPQFTPVNAGVTTRVTDVSRNLRENLGIPDELVEIMHSSGAVYFTKAEKALARANVVHDFKNASGLSINDAMSSFTVDGGNIKISAVYGTTEGGFLKPEVAFEQARLALRQYGIRDDEITLLAKQGLDHVPVKMDDVVNKDGNYLIRIDTTSEIDPTDIVDRIIKESQLEKTDVKFNLIDSISPWVPLITDPARWVMDAASMLHPVYTGSATVATDVTARFDKYLLDIASKFSDEFVKFSKERKAKINDYIKEANFDEIKFDVTDLTARGFGVDEISALKSWRDFWDAHYYLENYDVIRTLNSQGFELFENSTTKLVAKPISKNSTLGAEVNGNRVIGGTKIYNPATDSVTVLTKPEIEALYDAGGTVAKFRRTSNFDGVDADYMMVRNTPTEYTRKIRDTDQILNKRDGYYQLQYTAPRFVDQIIRDNTGKEIGRKAVAVAGDWKEAQAFADRMGKNDHIVRSDDRAMRRGNDDWWDVNSASGRIAQRHRGKLLEDSSGLNHLGDGGYILNPVESATRAAKSIAGRTITRPMLEAARARFLNQYGDVVPGNGYGGAKYPSSLNEIGAKGENLSKRVRDARTTWQYINYLENGYINGMDTFIKAVLNGMSEGFGKKGFSRTERAISNVASGASPLSDLKGATFTAYLGTHPLRQFFIQSHQAIRTASYNPAGAITGSTSYLAGSYLASKAGQTQYLSKHTSGFAKFFEGSGLIASIDKHSLIRGTLLEAANTEGRLRRTVKAPFNALRKVGFDAGEGINLLSHAASVYDRYVRMGKNVLDKDVMDEMHSEVRAITGEMNFAGDMPYNQTTPALMLQFMQVPHKAFLLLTNRRLDKATKARMFIGDMLLWGPPTLFISSLVGGDILPDDPKLREAVTDGFEGILLNQLFESVFGEESDIDWSGLDSRDTTGWAEFFKEMYSDGVNTMFINSPAGQLFFKDGGRVDTAISSMARYFAGWVDEQQKPEDFVGMLHNIAKISSGYNSGSEAYKEWMRAKLAIDSIERLDKYGSAVDKTVTSPEIIMKAFGFGTQSTKELYTLSKKVSQGSKEYKDQVMQVYKDAKQYYADKLGVENSDPRYVQAITGFIINAFRDDPEAMKMIMNQWKLDLSGQDQALLSRMMKASGVPDPYIKADEIRQSPIPEENKKELLKYMEDLRNARKSLKALEEQYKE